MTNGWLVFLVGLFIGANLGLTVAALCTMAAWNGEPGEDDPSRP
ncbi:hypothetical protein [uncultured Pseudacidovorax sp.]|nr:hypothetical protein [uncultured Pseudacidovorax sp.]